MNEYDLENIFTRCLYRMATAAEKDSDITLKNTGRPRRQSPGYITLFIFFCAIYPGDYEQQGTTF